MAVAVEKVGGHESCCIPEVENLGRLAPVVAVLPPRSLPRDCRQKFSAVPPNCSLAADDPASCRPIENDLSTPVQRENMRVLTEGIQLFREAPALLLPGSVPLSSLRCDQGVLCFLSFAPSSRPLE